MTGSDIEAALYDWNNHHRLRSQRQDVSFWQTNCRSKRSILVCGAGTGRVAGCLTQGPHKGKAARRVVALDWDLARLRRIRATAGLVTVVGDMRAVPLMRASVDAVIVPYSAFQLVTAATDRRRALRSMAGCLGPRGTIWLDVSSRFDNRCSTDWQEVLAAPCGEIGYDVHLWERTVALGDRLVLMKRFRRADGLLLVEIREEWMYERELRLEEELRCVGLALSAIHHGYGTPESGHRRIYLASASS